MDSTSLTIRIGTRVFHRPFKTREGTEHGGWTGTVVSPPPELAGPNGVPAGLYGVLADDGTLYGLAPDSLDVCDCDAGGGLQIAVERLHARREGLFHDMVCLVAASRRADVRDPATRMQIEAEVRRMSRSWGDADGARLRRKEFRDNRDLRRLLTKYLETGDLLQQLAELIGGDSS